MTPLHLRGPLPSTSKHADTSLQSKHADTSLQSKHADTSLQSKHADTSLLSKHADTSLQSKHADTSLQSKHADTSLQSKHADTSLQSKHADNSLQSKHADTSLQFWDQEMGGVWCRADRGQSTTYDSKGPFTSTLSRWTDHVRQVYRKPKTRHRPPRPPQKPIRSHERLTISPPQLVTEQSSDGWRSATLVVPQSAPIPPPRKKKKRLQELARMAYSMDDLNCSPVELSKSTFSLQEKYSFESVLDSKESSSTIVVTPVLESRANHKPVTLETEKEEIVKEDKQLGAEKDKDEDLEDIDDVDLGDEIIPVEKETMFTYRTLLHSNLGYIDKLSAISEVSAESGFDDRTDPGKYSERSESVASDEVLTKDVELNILEHIHNITSVEHGDETNIDVREKTAKSKKEWLENILRDESVPYFLSVEKEKKDSENDLLVGTVVDIPERPVSSLSGHLHLMNPDEKTFEIDNTVNKTSPSTPGSPIKHSVLLGLLRENEDSEAEAPSNPYTHEGESIFLTNTKTNIIYKSLSSDNLTDEYENEIHGEENKNILKYKSNTSEELLPNCNNFNVVSSFEFEDIKNNEQNILNLTDSQTSNLKIKSNCANIVINVVHSDPEIVNNFHRKESDEKLTVKESNKKSSATSSRRSSLTDSLHEFEMSIYDMLKESNKYQDSSDEEESIKTIKPVSRH